MSESLRRRVPFVSTEEDTDDGRVLDEQEQEEVLQELKDKSAAHNSQYQFLLHIVILLSIVLHLIYVSKTPRYSPFESLFPAKNYTPSLPLTYPFTLLHVTVHCLLIVQLLPQHHLVHSFLASNYPRVLTFPVLLGVSSIAPVLCLLRGGCWQDILWWAVTDYMVLFVHTAQKWASEEAESIQKLENLRYDAKGA